MQTVTLLSTVSAASDVSSAGFQLGDLFNYSVSVVFSGNDVAGTLTLQATDSEAGSGNWITVTGSSQAVTASANHMWNVSGANYRWVRVAWDYTSGTGNITITLTTKKTVVKPA